MAKFFQNLSKNIPPKARLVLATTSVLTGASAIYMVSALTNDSSEKDGYAGKAEVLAPPKTEQIDKSKPGEESIIPKNSPYGKEIEKSREEELESAKAKGGGFMDKIEISNSQEVLKELNEDSGGLLYQNIGGNIDDSLDQKDEIKKQRELIAQAKRDRANSTLNKKNAKTIQKNYEDQIKSEEDFINSEIEQYENNIYSTYIAGEDIYATNGLSSGYILNSAESDDSNSNGSSSSYNSSRSGKNSNSSSKGVNLTTLDKARSLASNGTSKSNTGRNEEQQGPDSSRNSGNSGNQRGNNQSSGTSSDSNYSMIVNPIGTTKVETTNHISAGEMHYAILQIGINTDEIGPVRALIPGNGKIGEAVMIGTPVLVGEKASISFKNMTIDGKDYPISAIALDPETMRPGLADDVDRHIFERYFKLAIAAAADGYVDAISDYSTTTTSSGTTETIYESLPDASDQIATAIGKVGEVLVPIFEEDFNMDPTITVNQNKDILIMFMSGVDIPNN